MGSAFAATLDAVEDLTLALCEGIALLARDAWRARAVLLHGGAIAGGWAFLTAGVAPLIAKAGLDPWPLSAGLFLLSLAGWKYLGVLFGAGLYALTRRPTRG